MKVRNILALCCTIILSLISCSKDRGPIKDTLSGSEWTGNNDRTGLNPKYEYPISPKLKFTSETEGVALYEFSIEDGGHMSKKEYRFNFTYELKGSSITLTFPESDEKEIKVSKHTAIGTLDREKGTIEFRYTEDGKEVSDVYHRSK